MNSVQALDYALRIVQGHRVDSPAAVAYKDDAITTLTALRDLIAEQQPKELPITEAYLLGVERGRINAPRSEGDEYGGGSWTDDWRRGWDVGYEQWDGKRGFRDVF